MIALLLFTILFIILVIAFVLNFKKIIRWLKKL